jgi:hypothetical protein
MLRVEASGDDPVRLENVEPSREHVGRDAGQGGEEILEAPGPGQEVADDEQGPALAQKLHRAGHRTLLAVLLGHIAIIGID